MIRDAVAGDFPAILELNAGSVHFLSPLDRDKLEHLHGQAAYHRVLDEGGLIGGFLLAFREGALYDSPNYQWFSERYPSFLYVDRAVVNGSCRRKGCGRALYDDLISHAAGLGIEALTCEIDISPPNPGSLLFHAGYGFREVGTQWLHGGAKQVSLREMRISERQDHCGGRADHCPGGQEDIR
jgi:uncharacterized protein